MQTQLNVIGRIRTPYKVLADCPCNIQFDGPLCEVHLDEVYQGELRGLKAGDNIMLLYWLGQPNNGVGYTPLTDKSEPGTFALRTPYRPNPIGVALLPIEKRGGGTLFVRGLDCLDGTELLDIKPAILREHLSLSKDKSRQEQLPTITNSTGSDLKTCPTTVQRV